MAINPASLSPQWQDKRLEQAFHLLDAVAQEWNPEDGIGEPLRQALNLVETADYEIEQLHTAHTRRVK